MAKISLVIEDESDGSVTLSMDAHGYTVGPDYDDLTPAQQLAVQFLSENESTSLSLLSDDPIQVADRPPGSVA